MSNHNDDTQRQAERERETRRRYEERETELRVAEMEADRDIHLRTLRGELREREWPCHCSLCVATQRDSAG